MLTPGQHLRALREQMGFTMRDVESATMAIAARHGNDDFGIALSRLSDIETKGIVPSIYRLYALAVVYRRDFRELLSWFGVDLNDSAADVMLVNPRNTHILNVMETASSVRIPVRLDPSFDIRKTANLGRMVEQWGLVPLSYLSQFANHQYSYGYIGSEDFSMYPILMPGAFVQIDESKTKIEQGQWRSEYERPVYFVETRNGYTCCWCAMRGDHLVLQPHPLSPVSVRMLKHPQDAEILGQVVGIAMRLGQWEHALPGQDGRGPSALN